MELFKINFNNKIIIIKKDNDGFFIKPKFIKDLEKYGTAMKPANEPICVARKPLSEPNVASNVLKWGTGGINIDDCRIETNEKLSIGSNKDRKSTRLNSSHIPLSRMPSSA